MLIANFVPSGSPEPLSGLIQPLREASRKLVREWGFLQPTFAGSAMSPAEVHCLIEIGDRGVRDSNNLCTELKVSREQLKHIISDLTASGHITTDDASNGHEPGAAYRLTPLGSETLLAINTFAQDQVTKALATAPPDAAGDIINSFLLYASALERARLADGVSTPDETRPSSPEWQPIAPSKPTLTISPGYRNGILARTLEMHMAYYPAITGWGREFEFGLGSELADILRRLDNPVNQVWAAVKTAPAQDLGSPPVESIVGVIYVDGEQKGRPDVARIRAFIVDGSARGLGAGKMLLSEAMAFIRKKGFRECFLITMRCLTAARRLYESEGFRIISEEETVEFGRNVITLKYNWVRDE